MSNCLDKVFFLNFEVGWVHNNIVKYLKFQKTHENSVKSLEKLCKTLWAVYDYDRFTWKIHNFVEITIFYLHKIFNIKNTINWWRKRKRSSLNRFIHEKIWLLIYVILFCQIFCFCGMALINYKTAWVCLIIYIYRLKSMESSQEVS